MYVDVVCPVHGIYIAAVAVAAAASVANGNRGHPTKTLAGNVDRELTHIAQIYTIHIVISSSLSTETIAVFSLL